MLANYGLYWHVSSVQWGWQNQMGQLLGRRRGADAISIDFRQQRGIYALYSEHELVYVGQTGNGTSRLLNRLRRHLDDHLSERWNRFSWFGIDQVDPVESKLVETADATVVGVATVLNVMEAVSIAIAEPRLNLQRGRWKDIDQYYQIRVGGEGVENDD